MFRGFFLMPSPDDFIIIPQFLLFVNTFRSRMNCRFPASFYALSPRGKIPVFQDDAAAIRMQFYAGSGIVGQNKNPEAIASGLCAYREYFPDTNGADYEARTRYLHLGKVGLYQMS